MRMFLRLAAVAAFMVVTTGASFANEAEIEAARALWMERFNSGDALAVAEQSFTKDAIMQPPNSKPLVGREAITAFWQGSIAAGVTNLRFETISIEVVGKTGIVTGTWAITVPLEGGGTANVGGNQILIFKKGSDGVWRCTRDIWNEVP